MARPHRTLTGFFHPHQIYLNPMSHNLQSQAAIDVFLALAWHLLFLLSSPKGICCRRCVCSCFYCCCCLSFLLSFRSEAEESAFHLFAFNLTLTIASSETTHAVTPHRLRLREQL